MIDRGQGTVRLRILIVSDAWEPQVNGVVRTLRTTGDLLIADGHEVEVIGPNRFRSIPCPTYPEIRLALGARRTLPAMIEAFAPDAIHIATEGPLGWAARRYCRRHGLTFTTSFHTMFPDYVKVRFGIPLAWTFAPLRRFHAASGAVMVATESIEKVLVRRGFENIVRWTRGVDTELFHPRDKDFLPGPRPIKLYVGRVAVEKNIEAFLSLTGDGSKYVVGDGPQRAALQTKYPDVQFVGAKHGEELARHYAAADVFVFPSRTDTFGLVMLEALASGVPVAAYPVPGPLDVIDGTGVGCLDESLEKAVEGALKIPADTCRAHALKHAWPVAVRQFLSHLHPLRTIGGAA